jgi:hypothetical protein
MDHTQDKEMPVLKRVDRVSNNTQFFYRYLVEFVCSILSINMNFIHIVCVIPINLLVKSMLWCGQFYSIHHCI